jgi:hypothetical protein
MKVLSQTQRREIERALHAYLSKPEEFRLPLDLLPVVRRAGALPVYADLGGALLIERTGRVLSISTNQSWDEDAVTEEERDDNQVTVAYVCAAELFPSLNFLRPARPPSAMDCSKCCGTGRLRIGRVSLVGCGSCWWLGWVKR